MSELDDLIEPMVSEIETQVSQLDDLRVRMFLHWLAVHSGRLKTVIGDGLDPDVTVLRGTDRQRQFKLALKTWLKSLPAEGLLWEYRLLLKEIGWWRDLEADRLSRIASLEKEK